MPRCASSRRKPASMPPAYGGVTDWKMQNVFEIFARWRDRYPPGTTHNTEHVFGLEVPGPVSGAPRTARAPALAVAAVARCRAEVFLVDQPRGDRSAARPRSRSSAVPRIEPRHEDLHCRSGARRALRFVRRGLARATAQHADYATRDQCHRVGDLRVAQRPHARVAARRSRQRRPRRGGERREHADGRRRSRARRPSRASTRARPRIRRTRYRSATSRQMARFADAAARKLPISRALVSARIEDPGRGRPRAVGDELLRQHRRATRRRGRADAAGDQGMAGARADTRRKASARRRGGPAT